MSTTAPRTRLKLRDLPKTYAGLVKYFLPRPIHDAVAYENTVAVVDALAVGPLTAEQEEFLDLLSQLVEAYDSEHADPRPKLSGLAALRLLLTENDLTGDDLATVLGVDRSTAFKILKGTRKLTADHIRRLAKRFAVSADLFLG